MWGGVGKKTKLYNLNALSATIAAKLIQVENQINLLYNLQLASELPLIK